MSFYPVLLYTIHKLHILITNCQDKYAAKSCLLHYSSLPSLTPSVFLLFCTPCTPEWVLWVISQCKLEFSTFIQHCNMFPEYCHVAWKRCKMHYTFCAYRIMWKKDVCFPYAGALWTLFFSKYIQRSMTTSENVFCHPFMFPIKIQYATINVKNEAR